MPVITGMPAGSPVAAAARRVTVPATSPGQRSGGSSRSRADVLRPTARTSRAASMSYSGVHWLAEWWSRTYAPVSRCSRATSSACNSRRARAKTLGLVLGDPGDLRPDRLRGQRRAAAVAGSPRRQSCRVEPLDLRGLARVSTPYRMAGRSGTSSVVGRAARTDPCRSPRPRRRASSRSSEQRAAELDELVPPDVGVHLDVPGSGRRHRVLADRRREEVPSTSTRTPLLLDVPMSTPSTASVMSRGCQKSIQGQGPGDGDGLRDRWASQRRVEGTPIVSSAAGTTFCAGPRSPPSGTEEPGPADPAEACERGLSVLVTVGPETMAILRQPCAARRSVASRAAK